MLLERRSSIGSDDPSTGTRERLLGAAIKLFGERGVDTVGTREIAAAAEAPMSSITYHFGGKEGIRRAAGLRAADLLAQQIAEFAAVPNEPLEAEAVLRQLVERLANEIVDPGAAGWTALLLRERLNRDEISHEVVAAGIGRVLELVTHLVARAQPILSPINVRAEAARVVGGVLALRLMSDWEFPAPGHDARHIPPACGWSRGRSSR